jgi:hypothetical protein
MGVQVNVQLQKQAMTGIVQVQVQGTDIRTKTRKDTEIQV